MSAPKRFFASDNYAGICPEAWAALQEANQGHAVAYGDDIYTERAADRLRDIFETACEVFFVFNGTAANSLSLATLCRSYHSIICHETAHVETDECGAPEFFSNGTKVLLVPGRNGKIDPDGIERMVNRRSDIHYPKPHGSALRRRRNWERFIRWTRSKPSGSARASWGCACTWMGRVSPTR
jgi:threonine aldolase